MIFFTNAVTDATDTLLADRAAPVSVRLSVGLSVRLSVGPH